jgi:hypothetical protein
MALLRSIYDDQTDYEDPIDRYQRRGKGTRTSHGETCGTASTANVLGIMAMVPFLGVIFTPLTFLLTFLAHKQLNANRLLEGRHLVRNAFLFGMIGALVNFISPVIFFALVSSR